MTRTVVLADKPSPASHRRGRIALYLRSLAAMRNPFRLARLDLPWWSFAAADWTEAFLRDRQGDAVAFEYGPGASTVWLARRCRRVTFVEHDPRWWSTVRVLTAELPNVDGTLTMARRAEGTADNPGGSNGRICESGRLGHRGLDYADYVEAIRRAEGPFDLIVIDGRARAACLREARKHLHPDGAILFDNSDRLRYRAAIAASGLAIERFGGLTPAAPYPTETSVLRHRRRR